MYTEENCISLNNSLHFHHLLHYRVIWQIGTLIVTLLLMVTGYMVPSMNSMGLFLFGTLLWVPMWDILDKYVQIDNKNFGISEQYKLLYAILPSIDLH